MGVHECHRLGSRECRRAKSCTNGGFLPNAGTSIIPAVVGSDSPDRLEGGARRTQLSDDDRATSRALDRDASRLSVPLSIPRRGLTRNFQPRLKEAEHGIVYPVRSRLSCCGPCRVVLLSFVVALFSRRIWNESLWERGSQAVSVYYGLSMGTLIRHYVQIFDVRYIRGQVYLNPDPKELMLRNHV
jgi:hypothetical protein